MGRIIASVKIDNVADESKSLRCDALVGSHMDLKDLRTLGDVA